jgi:UDP-glucuronate decarboxylase
MRKNDGRVINNFIVQALSGEELTIYGDGKHTHSFCHVDDLVQGLINLMNSEISIQGPINLGNPQEISIKSLAEKILELTNSESRITFHKLPEDDPNRRCPDIFLATTILDWKPLKNLDMGLVDTINYFKSFT